MEIDDLAAVAPDAPLEADVCIVGSGPAGMTLARELAGTGRSVLLLESGGLEPDDFADGLNEIEVVGGPRVVDQRLVRSRILGGTSHTWSGRVAALDEIDYRRRDWVPGSGWPVPRDVVQQYLPRTVEHLGAIVADNHAPDFVRAVAGRTPDPAGSGLERYAWSLSRDSVDRAESMRFGRRALRERMPGVRALTGATVTRIGIGEHGLSFLEVTGRDRAVRTVRTRFAVLAAGGIENARLLLAGRLDGADPHGPVGRSLMDHLRGPIAVYEPRHHARLQRRFGDRYLLGGRATPGYALSADVQAEERLLNCAIWLFAIPRADDPWTALAAVRRAPAAAVAAAVRHPLLLAEGAVRMAVRRRAPVRLLERLELHAIVEQQPDPANRITLSDRVDALGIPISRIEWRVGELERRTVRRTAERFVALCRGRGVPVPALLPFVTDDAAPFELPDVAHPMGATRMAERPGEGVVDADCAVFGVPGLFVAGSSVFPTGGHANPTQTIVALAVRLADHLKGLLATAP
ncbi:MAG TPA: GMC family oxidoreductase [Amnibacterium sp.]|nr:GMC family oxidoreductase [Amnibacterium sp.]